MSRRREKIRRERRKKHGSEHHLLPRSRGGPEKPFWNKADKCVEKHQAFHILSQTSLNKNLLPCEFINKIDEQWTTKSGKLKKSRLTKKQKDAWKILFDVLPKKAIEIIKEDWTVKDQLTFRGCFGYKRCFQNDNPDNPNKICPLVKLYKRGEIE